MFDVYRLLQVQWGVFYATRTKTGSASVLMPQYVSYEIIPFSTSDFQVGWLSDGLCEARGGGEGRGVFKIFGGGGCAS